MSGDETSVLLGLIQGEEGRSWAENRYGWNVSTEACRWEGIGCDQEGYVVSMNVANSGLSATIPPSISTISSLRRINFSNNTFYGTFPSELGRLPKLSRIDLSSNRLEGPLPVLTSEDLESVDMSHNTFTGSIPIEMIGRHATYLNLSENQLSGAIPSTIAIARKLLTLDLSKNKLEGSIPESLWSLSLLEFLHLDHNDLVGMLPSSFEGRDMSLKTIALHTNYLSGTIPEAFAFLPKLSILLLDDNKLTGTVPNALCESVVNGPLFGNDLAGFDEEPDTDDVVGVIDIGFTNDDEDSNTNEEGDDLFAGFNYGKRSLTYGKRSLQGSSANNPACDRIVCSAGYRSYKDASQKQGAFPCYKCGDDYYNPYLGAHRCLPSDERTLLDFIHFELVGPDWVGGANSWRDDGVETCDREGITCNDGGRVTKIELRGMNLVGSLPEEIGFFRDLEHLDLADNILTGTIPSSLHFPPLRTLDLRGNMLMGEVPSMLCKKEGVNGNGLGGIFTCDAIVCAVGSANPIGFADLRTEHDICFECVHGGEAVSYLGSTDCKLRPLSRDRPESQVSRGRTKLSNPTRTLLISLGMFLFFGYCYFRGRAQDLKAMERMTAKTKKLSDDDEDDDVNIKKRPGKKASTEKSEVSDGSEEITDDDKSPQRQTSEDRGSDVLYDDESLDCPYEVTLIGTDELDSLPSRRPGSLPSSRLESLPRSRSYGEDTKLSYHRLQGRTRSLGDGRAALDLEESSDDCSSFSDEVLCTARTVAAPRCTTRQNYKNEINAASSFRGPLPSSSASQYGSKSIWSKRVSFSDTLLPQRRQSKVEPEDDTVVGWRWLSVWDVQLMK